MKLIMPILVTTRLRFRPFTLEDFEAVYRNLDEGLPAGLIMDQARAARRDWLLWTVLSYQQRARLHRPPYGERAIALKETWRLVGAAGLVPSFDAFAQLSAFRTTAEPPEAQVCFPEVGLFYQIARADRRRGYAAEAARALIDYAFSSLRLGRIIATSDFDNTASIAVMEKLRMRIERNPSHELPWLQVVGVLENTTGAI